MPKSMKEIAEKFAEKIGETPKAKPLLYEEVRDLENAHNYLVGNIDWLVSTLRALKKPMLNTEALTDMMLNWREEALSKNFHVDSTKLTPFLKELASDGNQTDDEA
jgi:hypothetical protein